MGNVKGGVAKKNMEKRGGVDLKVFLGKNRRKEWLTPGVCEVEGGLGRKGGLKRKDKSEEGGERGFA